MLSAHIPDYLSAPGLGLQDSDDKTAVNDVTNVDHNGTGNDGDAVNANEIDDQHSNSADGLPSGRDVLQH